MAELQIYQGVRMHATGDDIGLPPNSADLQRVFLWDIGPEEPALPKEPQMPEGKPGDPKYEMAKLRYAKALKKYGKDLDDYERRQEEFERWHRQNGGPLELVFWSCDAEDALSRDGACVKAGKQERRRYYLSARTRGHHKLPNRGLPDGLKPGYGQAEQERREREGDSLLGEAMRADPVFGQQELRS